MQNELLAKMRKRQQAQGLTVDQPQPVKKTPQKPAQKSNSQFEANKNRLKAFFQQKQGGGSGATQQTKLPPKQQIKGNSQQFANARKLLEMNMNNKNGGGGGSSNTGGLPSLNLPPPPPPPSLNNLPSLPTLGLPPPPPPPPSFSPSQSSTGLAPPPRLSQVLNQPSGSSSSSGTNNQSYNAPIVQPVKTKNVPVVQATNNLILPPPPPPPPLFIPQASNQKTANNNSSSKSNAGLGLPPPPPPLPSYNQNQSKQGYNNPNYNDGNYQKKPAQTQNPNKYVHQPIFTNQTKPSKTNEIQQPQSSSINKNSAGLPPPPPYFNPQQYNQPSFNNKSNLNTSNQQTFNYYAKSPESKPPINTQYNVPKDNRQPNMNQINTGQNFGRTPPKAVSNSGQKRQRQQIFNSPTIIPVSNTMKQPNISAQFFGKDIAGFIKKQFIRQSDIMSVIGTISKKNVYTFNFPSIQNEGRQVQPNQTIFADVQALSLASCYKQKNLQSIKPHSISRVEFVSKLKNYNWGSDPEKLKLVRQLGNSIPSVKYVQPNFSRIKQGIQQCDKTINHFIKYQNFNNCAAVKKLKQQIEKGISFYTQNPEGNEQILEDIQRKIQQVKAIKKS